MINRSMTMMDLRLSAIDDDDQSYACHISRGRKLGAWQAGARLASWMFHQLECHLTVWRREGHGQPTRPSHPAARLSTSPPAPPAQLAAHPPTRPPARPLVPCDECALARVPTIIPARTHARTAARPFRPLHSTNQPARSPARLPGLPPARPPPSCRPLTRPPPRPPPPPFPLARSLARSKQLSWHRPPACSPAHGSAQEKGGWRRSTRGMVARGLRTECLV